MKQSITFISLFILSSLFACSQAQQVNSKSEQKLLAPKAFIESYKKDANAQLIDVRTKTEFNKGHLAKARNMNIYSDDFKMQIKTLDKQKPVYVYCHSGGRSAECVAELKNIGFVKLVDMDGGFSAWQKEGLPYEQ